MWISTQRRDMQVSSTSRAENDRAAQVPSPMPERMWLNYCWHCSSCRLVCCSGTGSTDWAPWWWSRSKTGSCGQAVDCRRRTAVGAGVRSRQRHCCRALHHTDTGAWAGAAVSVDRAADRRRALRGSGTRADCCSWRRECCRLDYRKCCLDRWADLGFGSWVGCDGNLGLIGVD